jgi:hypothetical protein
MLPRAPSATVSARPDDRFIASRGSLQPNTGRADGRARFPTLITAQHLKESPMWPNHPYVAQHLRNDRQDRLRQVSQHTRLLHDVKRIRRHQRIKT